MDVATRQDSLQPKVATIQAMSVGWVQLVRSLRAVPLFGVGFGELVQPVRKEGQLLSGCCPATASMPIGKDLLAVYGADLQDMLRAGGSRRRNPWRLAGNVHWHCPDGVAFESCKCPCPAALRLERDTQGEEGIPSTPPQAKRLKGLFGILGHAAQPHGHTNQPSPTSTVQVLLPITFPRLFVRGLRSPTNIVARGAVMFGHSSAFPLRWNLTKNTPPVEGEPDPPSAEDISASMHDSGIGTSVGSPEMPNTGSFYSQGSNVGFSFRGGGSSHLGEPSGLLGVPDATADGSMGAENDVAPTTWAGLMRKRPRDTLEGEGRGSANKVRRQERRS
jgi:hypothetical protein